MKVVLNLLKRQAAKRKKVVAKSFKFLTIRGHVYSDYIDLKLADLFLILYIFDVISFFFVPFVNTNIVQSHSFYCIHFTSFTVSLFYIFIYLYMYVIICFFLFFCFTIHSFCSFTVHLLFYYRLPQYTLLYIKPHELK